MEDNIEDKEKNKDSEISAENIKDSLHSGENIQTYTKDLTKAIESNQGRIIKKMIQGQEGDRESNEYSSVKSSVNKIFATISIVLLALAVGAIIVVWVLNHNDNTIAVKSQPQSLIFTDQTQFDEIKDLSKDEIGKSIANIGNDTTVKIGGIEAIYPTINKKNIGLREFMIAIEGNLDLKKYPSISDNFLLGAMRYIPVENSNIKDITPVPLVPPESKQITLNSSVFFKTGTTEFVDTEAKEKAKNTISDFLQGIDFSTTQISVIGSFSVERPSSKNPDLAEARKKVGLDILNEVLNQKYSKDDISKIIITSEAKGLSIYDNHTKDEIDAMTKEELNSTIDSTQGIQYFLQAKTKPNTGSVNDATSPIETTTGTNSLVNPINDTNVADDNDAKTDIDKDNKSKIGFFMLIQADSFSDTLPAMHEWESKILSDLHDFFDIETNSSNQYLLNKEFEDAIIQNKNARILRDNNGNIVFMYVFVNHNSVVITDSNEVVKELIARLFSAQLKQ